VYRTVLDGENSSEKTLTEVHPHRSQAMSIVSFCAQADVLHDHLSRHDYSKKEHKQTWYSKKELSAIQRETQTTITWIMGGKHGGESRFCSIGLESKTPAKSRILKLRRQQAIRTVLKAQGETNTNRKKDTHPELIAKVYASYSTPSLEDANAMASFE
jgi:hypothetical protein